MSDPKSWTREEKTEFMISLRSRLRDKGLKAKLKTHKKEENVIEIWLRDNQKYAVVSKEGAIMQYFDNTNKLPFKIKLRRERVEEVLKSFNYKIKGYAII